MSLHEDTSSIELVLNSVGTSLVHRSDHRSSPDTLKEAEASARTSGRSPESFDVSSRLAQGSAADLDALSKHSRSFQRQGGPTLQDSIPKDHSSAKRKRAESVHERSSEQRNVHPFGHGYDEKGQSRDLMPPPPIPIRRRHGYIGHIESTNLDEILHRNQTAEFGGPRSVSTPIMLNNRQHAIDLKHHHVAKGCSRLAAVSHVASNDQDLVPHSAGILPLNQPMNAGRPPKSTQSHLMIQDNVTNYRESRKPFSQFRFAQASPRRQFQGFSHERLFTSPAKDSNASRQGFNFRRYGSSSSLGLSGNSRSSHRLPSQSLTQVAGHRRRLGDTPAASPHFQPRGLSISSLRPPLHAYHNPQSPRTTFKASDMITAAGSVGPLTVHDALDSLVEQDDCIEADRDQNGRDDGGSLLSDSEPLLHAPRIQANQVWVDRGRDTLTDPHSSTYGQPDPSRSSVSMVYQQPLSTRRKANR